MPLHDDLGTRMKTYFEQIPKLKLMRRTPVAVRVDGKAFHTFTRGLHNEQTQQMDDRGVGHGF